MKRSPQVRLSAAVKRSLLSLSILSLAFLLLGSPVLATTPIAVDLYQDMETGNAGDLLTNTMMNASSHPSSGWATTGAGLFWVSTQYHRDLPGPVTVGGVTYNGTGGSRSWVFNNNNQGNSVQWSCSSQSNMTVACYYTTLTTLNSQVGYDTINMWGGSFSCLQTLAWTPTATQAGPLIRQHSSFAWNGYVTATPGNTYITPGKTYWVNMKYDGSVAQVFAAAFDPDNGYAQVGTTMACYSVYNDGYYKSWFGRNDGHGNQTNETTQSYFDQIMFDYTNAAFPLLPSGCNDTTAPGAPPTVRDGTGPDQDQTIAMSSTQLSANWDMAWDAESGIKAYQYAIGTSAGGTNIVNWTTLKNQLGITKTGLSLTNGQTYYFAVRAINGVGLTGPITNSHGQTYGPTDTTAPSAPPAVRDGGGFLYAPDIDWNADPHDLYANYDPCTDNESGISGYQYCMGTTPGGTDTVNWSNLPGLCRAAAAVNIYPPNGVATGVRYYTTVRAVNNAGITGPATTSNGQVVANNNDTTPPSAPPVVRDGTGSTETSTTTSTTQLSANWDNGSDPESGIRCYYYSIGTTPGGNNIVNQVQTSYDSPVSHVTVTGLNLTVGQTYYFSVSSRNGVFLASGNTNSSGQTVVSGGGNQPPSAPANVRDGTGADIAYTTSNSQLSANWDACTDPDGSVTAYQYAIGTSAGGTQTVNWTTLGNVTTVTKTGLSLINAQTYYFSVKAVDNQGLAGNATNSNGQKVDTTAPSAPANVRDGLGTDISTTSSTTQLSANWDAATDADSGISGYQYAIGTSAGGTQTVNWTSLGNVTTVTKTGLTLSVGQTYYFSVQAVNGAGLTGSATNSNGQTVVSGGSSATPVDLYQDMENGNNNDVLTATIMNASMHPSGSGWVTGGGTMWVSTSHHNDLPGPVIVGGVTYNGTGGTRSWVVNNNIGLNNVNYVGSGHSKLTVAYYYTTNTTIQNSNGYEEFDLWGSLIWVGVQTANGDGNGPYLRMDSKDSSGNGANSGQIKITTGKTYWINLKYDSAAYMSSLAVFDPTNSFAQVGSTMTVGSGADSMTKACIGRCDNYGNLTNDTTQSWFDQLLFDWTNAAFPLIPSAGTDSTPPAVRDGTGADISTTNSTTQLSANWDASTDNESGISGYQYAIGTTAGGTQTVNWTSLGNVTTVTKTGLTLSVGQTYYFSVKAVNGVGLTGSATNSNGQTVVDVTPPSAPANVRDGTGTDISTTSSTTQLSANWDAATDAESGISGYQYAIGTSAGGTQTVNWTSLGNVTTVTKTGLTLSVGQTYYFSVQAVNGAGLTGSATNSNGQTVVSGSSVIYFQDNFESWTAHGGAWSSVTGETSTQTLNTSTDYAKAGAKSLKLTDTDTTSLYGAYLTKNFSPVISGDVYVRFFVYLPTGYTSANTGDASRRLLHVFCGSNRGQMSLAGATPLMEEVGAWGSVLAPSALSENAWHCIEMHMVTPSASTLMEFWVDGVKNSATLNGSFSGSSTYDKIDFGDISLGSGVNGNGTFYMDELVVSNSYIGTGITSPVTYFSDTFDSWSVHGGAWSSVLGENSNHTLNTSADQARSGTKSLKLTDTDSTGTTGASLTKNFSPVISGDIYVRFYVFLPTGYESANTGCVRRLLRVWCQSNRGQMSINAGIPKMEEVGAWGWVQSSSLSENAWHCIEMHVTTPAATTALEFWVDGVWINPGLTANFSTSTTWDHIDFGDVVLATGCTNCDGTFYLDELVVSNSYIGPLP